MGIDVPDLDDRRYEELLESAIAKIPARAPGWTDHNAHDPGITILEVLAWLTESYGYQLDQVTDDHRKRYLELVGVTPRPPRPARIALTLDRRSLVTCASGSDDAGDGADGPTSLLPAGTPIVAEAPDDERMHFETERAVAPTAAELVAVVSEHERGRTDHTTANETPGLSFEAFGRDAGPEATLYLGFDADPFALAGRLDLTFQRSDDRGTPERDVETEPGTDGDATAFEPSIEVVWEHPTEPAAWHRDGAWQPIEGVEEETTQFYEGGRVIVPEPDSWLDDHDGVLDRDGLYWLRCSPSVRPRPRPDGSCLERPGDDEPTPTPNERYEDPPTFDRIAVNAVPAVHRRRAAEEALERVDDPGGDAPAPPPTETTGEAGQRFSFPDAPVDQAAVFVDGESWAVVPDFGASGPDDRHCTLERAAGRVRFGDGRRGAIPPAGASVVARSVRYGGGTVGNVQSDATWRIVADGYRSVRVRKAVRVEDGRDAESVAEVLARARDARSTVHRAVTAADYETLAEMTPGVRVARAAAIVAADGADGPEASRVTVVVVPEGPAERRAIPTRGFLEAVECHLRERTLLTDRVSVVGPRYVGVRVSARVRVEDGFDPDERAESAEERLRAYLDPQHGYEGAGWPFDRGVYESDLYERLESLAGLADVLDVSVAVDGDLAGDGRSLPYPASVSVTVRADRERCGRGFE